MPASWTSAALSSSMTSLTSRTTLPVTASVIFSSETRPMMRSRSGSMISPLSTMARASMPSTVPQSVLGDDDVLGHVDQAPGQVARVGGLQRGVGQTLAGAVGRDEVLEHRQPFAEVGANRRLDDFARRLGHQAAHAGQLADLLLAAAGARVGHDVDRVERPALTVELLHLGEHLVGDLLGHVRPHGDDLVLALAVGDRALEVLLLDPDHLVAGLARPAPACSSG